MISFENIGDFKNTIKFLNFFKKQNRIRSNLERYAAAGVSELAAATPVDTGETASLWGYEIHESNGKYEIIWTNDNINDGIPVVILLQYGHATRNGGYVYGADFINPPLKKIFNDITKTMWEEVVNA